MNDGYRQSNLMFATPVFTHLLFVIERQTHIDRDWFSSVCTPVQIHEYESVDTIKILMNMLLFWIQINYRDAKIINKLL